MKRIGVAGLGKMGILHASLINHMPSAELVGVVDKDKSLRRSLRGTGIKVPFYQSLENMLQAEDPDGIIACVPSSANSTIAKACAERGVSILVEKPLANSLKEAEEMIHMVDGKDLKHGVGFMLAYVPTFLKAKEILDEDIIGQIKGIEASVYLSAVFSKQKGWFYSKESSGGGAIVSLGSHLLFLLTWFFGPVKQVEARLVYDSGNEVEDGGRVNIELREHIEATMDVSWSSPGYETMRTEMVIHGSQGTLSITNEQIELWLDGNEHKRIHISQIPDDASFYLGGDGYYSEDEDFVSCIGTDKQPRVTWREGLQVQRTLHAIYRSAETGVIQQIGL